MLLGKYLTLESRDSQVPKPPVLGTCPVSHLAHCDVMHVDLFLPLETMRAEIRFVYLTHHCLQHCGKELF